MSVARKPAPKPASKPAPALYETDFAAWSERQGALLRAYRLGEADLDNIAEEIETLGRSERHRLVSQMTRLLVHLLKWTVQPERRGNSWRLSIATSRDEIDDVLSGSPSLRRELPAVLAKCYPRAVRDAVLEIGRTGGVPAECPFTVEQVLDPDFMPD